MKVAQELRIPVPTAVRSLCWEGDSLVDWTGGARRLGLDGTVSLSGFGLAYTRFDSALATADGRCAVVYERRGTKGLLLYERRVLREIGRSYYHADQYDYPVALVRRPGGRLLLVHCPDDYNRLEVEDFLTGARLSHRRGAPPDVFHARLLPSPDGRLLLAEGWLWHPLDVVHRIDLDAALADPRLLDMDEGSGLWEGGEGDALSAAFGADGEVLLNSATSRLAREGDGHRWWMEPRALERQDFRTGRVLHRVVPEEVVGQMMPVGHTHVVGFHQHPKLVDLATGRVVHRWPELATGFRLGSAHGLSDTLPPLALDPRHRRFAVSTGRAVVVVTLGECP
jgi:hypothetical protein